jgi:hypothetical protein
VSLSSLEKESLLLKAFDQGAVVLIDEINSGPMMERLLNDLLMGRRGDGQRPKNPGFMVIGTQNPASMAGRRAPSTALSRRMIQDVLPDYSAEEMYEILKNKSVPQLEIRPLVRSFLEQQQLAQLRSIQPIPSFRDLLLVADRISNPVVTIKTSSQNPHRFYVIPQHSKRKLEQEIFISSDTQERSLKVQRSEHLSNIHATALVQNNGEEADIVLPPVQNIVKRDLLFLEWLKENDKSLAAKLQIGLSGR